MMLVDRMRRLTATLLLLASGCSSEVPELGAAVDQQDTGAGDVAQANDTSPIAIPDTSDAGAPTDTAVPADSRVAPDTAVPAVDTLPACVPISKSEVCGACGNASDGCGGSYECGTCSKERICIKGGLYPKGACGCMSVGAGGGCKTPSGASGWTYTCGAPGTYAATNPDCGKVTTSDPTLDTWCCPL